MPAVDYTLWLRDCLLAGDKKSIVCLLMHLGRGTISDASALQVGQILYTDMSDISEPHVAAELRAVMILVYRIGGHDASYLWPRIWAAVLAAHSDKTPLSAELRGLPPTFRLVLVDAWRRWSERPWLNVPWGLGYSERRYGCNSKWNEHYGNHLRLFANPSLSTPLPGFITKAMIIEEAALHGLVLSEKQTKPALHRAAQQVPDLITALWSRCMFPLRIWNRERYSEVNEWVAVYEDLLPMAKQLCEAMAQVLLRTTPGCLHGNDQLDSRSD